jgi:hypothetical protein
MKTSTLLSLIFSGLLLAVLAAVSGCGTTPASGGGYGADAGPWPQAPTRSTATTPANPDQPPTVPITFTLRGKAAAGQELRLNVTQIELRYGERWHTVAKAEDIARNEALPLRFGAKEGFALLTRTTVPRRSYNYVRLTFAKEKTVLVRENTPDAVLTVPATVPLPIGEWTPSDTKPNLITITLEGGKLKIAETPTLPADAFTAKALSPSGGISGKITPAAPTARVDVYWGASKVLLGSVTPSSQDGSFTLSNLPAGQYRVDVNAPGQQVSEPLKEAVAVEDKMVALKAMELVAATPTNDKK